MGIYERDYTRAPAARAGVFGAMRLWSVSVWLIAVNVAVFVLDAVLDKKLRDWGHFSAEAAIFRLQLWRFVTFQFLHGGVNHLLFNMLSLYFFGPLVEGYLGSRRFLAFYLLCGMAGAVAHVGLSLPFGTGSGALHPMVGASAGVFGVLIAGARVAPDRQVMLLFPPIPMKLKVLAWILIGVEVYMLYTGSGGNVAHAAHLGGAALGYLLIRRPDALNFAGLLRLPARRGPSGRFGRPW